ncbi:unnamed protein product, partial [Brenthis ino]
MDTKPCKVCGGTDLSLVDGFYYCVECGTQDVEARETVVEQTILADGTFAHTTTRKLTTILNNSLEMSGEWMKWHAYNFILAGLTEELIAVGAKTSVKMVVLWIWTKYIKMFQDKEALRNKTHFENGNLFETNEFQKEILTDSNSTESDEEIYKSKKRKTKKKDSDKFKRDIIIVTKGTLLTILYVALNLDRSDIQLSHLFRFIKEGRLSLFNCAKFVPKEINMKSIPHWKSFVLCRNDYTPKVIRAFAMTFFKRLDLGVPLVPDLTKMISNFTKELCLPNDFKHLVLSLMDLMPCDFLKLDSQSKKTLIRIPDYEGVCMSYMLVALKMCFGLDCDYEIRLSNEVDKINNEKNHLKSYKLGLYSDLSDRLFSYNEWYQYLQFRKMILCKNYLPMARIYNLHVDDCVLMEQLEDRGPKKMKLSDDVTMDIINKILVNNEISVISKNEFPSTLTPMTTYTEVILQYIQDPDMRLLLCEDFTQYSLKYAINQLRLPDSTDDSTNFIIGVRDTNKTINPFVIGTLKSKKGDNTMVFVRNCENRNWLKTKPPSIEHVTKLNDNKKNSDKESDNGYESNLDCTPVESDETQLKEESEKDHVAEERVLETIEEEDDGVNIFDDYFTSLDEKNEEEKHGRSVVDTVEGFNNFYDSNIHMQDTFNDDSNSIENEEIFDPKTFDRHKVINELIEIACKKYKIPIPKQNGTRERTTTKRKRNDNNVQIDVNKRKRNDEEANNAKLAVKSLISAYYETIEKDALANVIENVRSYIDNINEEGLNNTSTVSNANNVSNIQDNEMENENNTQNYTNNESNGNDDVNTSVISSIHPSYTLNDTNLEEDDTLDESVVKTDPKFDTKTHDIKQLYIKLNEDLDLDETFNIEDDVEIEKIIQKKIEEFANNENIYENLADVKNFDGSDSEDDLPLSELANQKKSYTERRDRSNAKLDNLVENTDLKEFNYWVKHYKSRLMRCVDMNQKFDLELMKNCPVSFVFVIHECAAILNCTTFSLYKSMQYLEEIMLSYRT